MESYTRLPSTQWTWEMRKIRRAAGPRPDSAGAAGTTGLARRSGDLPRKTSVTITVRYRGGPEAWWELRSVYGVCRVPGHIAIHDVMRLVLGQLEEG